MRFVCTFLLFVVGIVVRIIVSSPEVGRKVFPVKPVVRKVSAAYFRPLDEVVPYESTAKLIFAVQLPAIDVFHAKVTTKLTYEAIQTTARMIKDDFKNYLKGFEGAPKRGKRQAVLAAGIAGGILLHSIYSSFTKKLMGTDDEAKYYINELRSSLAAQQREFLLLHHDVDAFARDYSVFVDKFYRAVSDSEQTDLALLHLNQVQIAIDKIEKGLERCSNSFFPTQLVDIPSLQKQLKVLEKSLSTTGYRMVFDPQNIAKLLKLKTSDCFITNSTIYLQANIPVQKNQWVVQQLLPIPFAFQNQTCSLSSTSSEIIAINRDDIRIIDDYMLEFCDFHDDHLCLIPQFSRPSSQTAACAASLFHGTTVKDISSQCTFRCISTNELMLIQVEKDKVVAVNADKVSVKCPEKYFDYGIDSIGSTLISIKCGCDYKVADVPIDNSGICVNEQFQNDDVVYLFPNFMNISKEAKAEAGTVYRWPSHVSVLNFTPPEIYSSPGFDVHTLSYGDWWMMTLSIIALMIMCVLLYAFCYFRNLQ